MMGTSTEFLFVICSLVYRLYFFRFEDYFNDYVRSRYLLSYVQVTVFTSWGKGLLPLLNIRARLFKASLA